MAQVGVLYARVCRMMCKSISRLTPIYKGRSRSPFRIDPVTSELDECALLMIVVLDFPLACLQILQLNLGSSFTLPKFCNLLEEDLPPLQGFAH